MDSDFYKEIGANLRRYRSERKIRQSELARKLGVSPSQYYKYEEGQSKPSIPKLIEAAELLGIELDALMPADVLSERDPQAPAHPSVMYEESAQTVPSSPNMADRAQPSKSDSGFELSSVADSELLGELISAFLALPNRDTREKLVRFLKSL